MTRQAEPEWDEETRNLALANDAVEICPKCGRPTFVCQDPEHQFDWKVPAPVRCHAATALLQAAQRVTEETNPQAAALVWDVRLEAE